jgi:hypothetical protein
MKKSCIIFTAIVLVITMVVAVQTVSADAQRRSHWEEHREVITVYIDYGDTLHGLWVEYGPSWMDRREWTYEVMTLNGMDSCMLYAGQTLKLYVEGGE